MLDIFALIVIFALLILVTVIIVCLGSLPGKIARDRNHPWPDAVTAAGWVGLATGVLWPLAFIWAFLPLPAKPGHSDGKTDSEQDLASLKKRIAELESANQQLLAQAQEGSV